jgi:hypothetical protein
MLRSGGNKTCQTIRPQQRQPCSQLAGLATCQTREEPGDVGAAIRSTSPLGGQFIRSLSVSPTVLG